MIRFNEFKHLLSSVDLYINGKIQPKNVELLHYHEFHADRYYLTYKMLSKHIKEGDKVLDIGPNPYYTTLFMHLNKVQVSGVSGGYNLKNIPEPQKEEKTETKLGDREYQFKINTGCNLEEDKLPFADNFFDCVLFLEIIEHFIKNPINALTEIARVLRPGGKLILTTDNSHSMVKLIKFLSFKPIYWPYSDQYFGDRHNREYMPMEILKLLSGVGYKDVSVNLKNLSPYSSAQAPLGKKLGYLFSNTLTRLPYFNKFKRQIFVTATKSEIRDYKPGWLFMRQDGWLESL